MGKYQDGNYYRDDNDGELQWLEDGTNLVGQTFIAGLGGLLFCFCQLGLVLISVLTSDND